MANFQLCRISSDYSLKKESLSIRRMLSPQKRQELWRTHVLFSVCAHVFIPVGSHVWRSEDNIQELGPPRALLGSVLLAVSAELMCFRLAGGVLDQVRFGPLLLCPPRISSWGCWDGRSMTPQPTFYVGSRWQNPILGIAWHTTGCWAMFWPHKVFIRWLCSNLISFCLLKAKTQGRWPQLLSSPQGGLVYCPLLSRTPILTEMKYSLSCCSVTTGNIRSYHWIRLALEVWGGR